MTNPFDDEAGEFAVLVNEEGQYSLWPMFKEIPAGWTAVLANGTRQECTSYVEEHWTDMRPRRLIAHLNESAGNAHRTN